jgi:uncharacterized membrane protein
MKRGYFTAALILTLLAIAISVALYPRLPDRIPTHWNIHGKVDDYGAKQWALFVMPATMVFLVVLFRVLSWLSPKQFSIEPFRPTFDFVMFLVVALMAYIHTIILWIGIHGEADMSRFFLGGLFLFFAALGNVLGKVRRNFWLGVRTPWTLASERVWNDTHRFSARIFVLTGLSGFLITIFGGSPIISMAIIMIAAGVCVLYSLVEYKRLEKRGEV